MTRNETITGQKSSCIFLETKKINKREFYSVGGVLFFFLDVTELFKRKYSALSFGLQSKMWEFP